MIILPAIDIYGGKAVRLYKGDYRRMTVYSDDPLEVAFTFKSESDFMNKSEREVMETIKKAPDAPLQLYKTFRTMTKIEHTDEPLPDHFCVSIDVKQRYINPLVQTGAGDVRLADISPFAKKIIDDFIAYKDTKYGCVKLVL